MNREQVWFYLNLFCSDEVRRFSSSTGFPIGNPIRELFRKRNIYKLYLNMAQCHKAALEADFVLCDFHFIAMLTVIIRKGILIFPVLTARKCTTSQYKSLVNAQYDRPICLPHLVTSQKILRHMHNCLLVSSSHCCWAVVPQFVSA